MSATGVFRRHRKSCDRQGRCRCPWAYYAEVRRAADGKRQQVTKSGFSTEAEAKRERARAIREVSAGATLDDRRVDMATYLDRWLTRREDSGTLRASTIAQYRDYVRRFLVPTLGRVRLTDLNDEHVTRAFRTIRDEHPHLSPASLRRIHATLRAALRAAVKSGQITRDVSQGVELPRADRPTVKPWQPAQFGAFLDHPAVSGHRLAPAVLLAGMGGLRRGEVAGLRWSDVDLDRGRLVVAQQAVCARTLRTDAKPGESRYVVRVTYTPPKTSAGAGRVVDLDRSTVVALRSWRSQQAAERLAWGPAWQDTGLVFTREDGTGWDPSHLGKTFGKMVERARFDERGEPVTTDDRERWEEAEPLPRVRFHDLRHLQASLMLAAGVPMPTVSKRLGHSTIGITVDTYGHMLDGIGSQAAEAAAALIPRRSTTGS